MKTMTLEELLRVTPDEDLLAIHFELHACVVPATGYAHAFCRKVNHMIDAGDLCISPTSYRKVYLPTLAKAVLKEMANRYANYCRNMKADERFTATPLERNDEEAKCSWCEEEFDMSDLHHTDLGNLCDTCITAIRSRGERVVVYD